LRGDCGLFKAQESAHCLIFSNTLYAAFLIKEMTYIYEVEI